MFRNSDCPIPVTRYLKIQVHVLNLPPLLKYKIRNIPNSTLHCVINRKYKDLLEFLLRKMGHFYVTYWIFFNV